MKLFIPEIGTELILIKEWSFKLILEHRNTKLIKYLYPNYYNERYSYYNYIVQELGYNGNCLRTKKLHDTMYSNGNSIELWENNKSEWIPEENLELSTLPIGTILKIDRIYIRKGKNMSDYSSLSFYATIPGVKNKIRFFAHLNDVNNIECTIK